MTAPALAPPGAYNPCDYEGYPATPAGWTEGDEVGRNEDYQFGRGGEMYLTRLQLGLSVREMADAMKVRLQTYQRWENGGDPIHVEIWDRVNVLLADQETKVQRLLDQIPADAARFEVPIRRYESAGHPLHQMWQQVVMFARMRDPRIVPVFPDDDVYVPRRR